MSKRPGRSIANDPKLVARFINLAQTYEFIFKNIVGKISNAHTTNSTIAPADDYRLAIYYCYL